MTENVTKIMGGKPTAVEWYEMLVLVAVFVALLAFDGVFL